MATLARTPPRAADYRAASGSGGASPRVASGGAAADWRSAFDTASGQVYYYRTTDRTPVWSLPPGVDAAAVRPARRGGAAVASSAAAAPVAAAPLIARAPPAGAYDDGGG